MSGLPNPTPRFSPSSLLQYLPAIYSEDPFLAHFLLGFEKLLFGRDDGVEVEGRAPAALEPLIAGLASYFDPFAARADFLPWLASWTQFTLRFDLNEMQQRKFIARIIPLYRKRGTRQNLIELLRIFTLVEPEISEAGDVPHFFTVTVRLPMRHQPPVVLRQIAITNALVVLQKPAHTSYELRPDFPGMQIGVQSRLGVDTLLGTVPEFHSMQLGVYSMVGVDILLGTVPTGERT